MLPYQIKKENNIGTFKFILLNGLTFGILSITRISKLSKIIDKISGKSVFSDLFITSIQVIKAFSIFNLFVISKKKDNDNDNDLSVLSYVCKYSYIIFYIAITIWAFKAKEEIEEYAQKNLELDYKMNSLYTFFFDIFYINYCLNDLSEKEK